MDKILEQTLLYDFYGELLTDHQKQIYEDVVLNDYSFSEVAEEKGCLLYTSEKRTRSWRLARALFTGNPPAWNPCGTWPSATMATATASARSWLSLIHILGSTPKPATLTLMSVFPKAFFCIKIRCV